MRKKVRIKTIEKVDSLTISIFHDDAGNECFKAFFNNMDNVCCFKFKVSVENAQHMARSLTRMANLFWRYVDCATNKKLYEE